MKKLLLLLTLCGILFLAILCKPSEHDLSDYNPPIDGTIVRADAEDVPKKKDREAWLELMHQAEEGVDWKEIEIQNRKEQAARKLQLRKENGYQRNTSEVVANGNLRGRWLERGSNNNAGNMITVNYLVEDDMLYGRSDGGTLWKGDRTGFNWEVINQDYRFSGDLIEARYLEDGTLRIIADLNRKPVYSDDGGITWNEGQGINANGGAYMKDFNELDNGDIFVLQRSNGGGFYAVYRSQDNAENWEKIKTFQTSNERNLNLTRVSNTQDLMVIEQLDTDRTGVYLWNSDIDNFDNISTNSQVGFGDNNRANLNATFADDTLRMYVLNHENNLHVSKDTSRTWEVISNTPTSPWAVGIYVSPSDHSKLLYGEVNPYRSKTGGKFWNQVSVWWEYYADIFTKLHADIMDIKEFKDQDGIPFTVVCNHGGISQSYDYGETYTNIGLISLNISQYYSVVTHPTEREFIFAGAQDQGFQRGKVFGDDIASLDQVFSGDYGHIVFSGTQNNMWTVYPWGSVSYFSNPLIQGPTAGWTIPDDNNNAWIPPLVPHPDNTQNSIFIAGGNLDTLKDESHLIQLDINSNGQIVPTEFPFDFSQFGGSLSAIGFNHFNHDEIYTLTSNGQSYKSIDGGQTFERKELSVPGGHWLYGSCIKASKLDPNVVYISGSGYSNSGVFKSTDAGETYQPLGTGLPSTLVFCIAPNEDESLIFAATEAGPYVYVTALEEWFDLSGVGTPNQRYWSVEYLDDSKTVRFGTYGRGIWDFEVEEQIISSITEIASRTRFTTYPNPFTDKLIINSDYEDLTNVAISDQQGRLIKKFSNKKIKNLSIDLSDLNNGIYFVTIRMNNKSVTEKIVKN